MGVSYYHCKCCEESLYSEYVKECEGCGKNLCTHCLINNDIGSRFAHDYCIKYDGSKEQKEKYGIEDDWEEKGYITLDEVIDDTGINPKYCPFCQGEAFDERKFIEWMCEKLGKSYSELMNDYLNNV